MEAYVERMINEFGELNEKIDKLKVFVKENEDTLDNLKRDLLVSQCKAMEAYLGILAIRIGLENTDAEEGSIHGQE